MSAEISQHSQSTVLESTSDTGCKRQNANHSCLSDLAAEKADDTDCYSCFRQNSDRTQLVASTYGGSESLEFASLSYFGGSGFDNVDAVSRDDDGFIYIAGSTTSRDLPGLMVGLEGAQDAFVAKLSPDAQRVIFVRLLGGSDLEAAYVMSVPRDGAIWVAGVTMSSDFPLLHPAQSTYAGGQDVFVAELDTNSGTLLSSTYLGGHDVDFPGGIAVDSKQRCWVTGTTSSREFPLDRPVDDAFGGGTEAFATRISPPSPGFEVSTLIGGSSRENGGGCAVDEEDNLVMCGTTTSRDFKVKHPFQSELSGDQDVFVVRLAQSGDVMLSATFLGGEGLDFGEGLCLDRDGYVFVVGITESRRFPLKRPVQQARKGSQDAFVTKMDRECRRLLFSTYLGGSANDGLKAVSVGEDGAPVVSGLTFSSDLPVVRAPQAAYGGSINDGFAAKLSASGGRLVISTFIGGGDLEFATSVSSASGSDMLIGGFTSSLDLPVVNALQDELAGQELSQQLDAFFAWIYDPQGFQISLVDDEVEVHAGETIDVDVGVVREVGVDGPIVVSVADERAVPIRGGVSQTELGEVVRLRFAIRRNARPGTYRLPIFAEDALGRSRSVTLRVVVLP